MAETTLLPNKATETGIDSSYLVITSYSIHYTKLYDAGGSYEIAGNHYQEMIIYHASDEIVGSQANMIMELKGDSLIQTWPVTESGEIDWDNYSQETYVKLD